MALVVVVQGADIVLAITALTDMLRKLTIILIVVLLIIFIIILPLAPVLVLIRPRRRRLLQPRPWANAIRAHRRTCLVRHNGSSIHSSISSNRALRIDHMARISNHTVHNTAIAATTTGQGWWWRHVNATIVDRGRRHSRVHSQRALVLWLTRGARGRVLLGPAKHRLQTVEGALFPDSLVIANGQKGI